MGKHSAGVETVEVPFIGTVVPTVTGSVGGIGRPVAMATLPTLDGAEPVPKKVRSKPDEITALRRVAAVLETQGTDARMRICHYLADYFGALEYARDEEAKP